MKIIPLTVAALLGAAATAAFLLYTQPLGLFAQSANSNHDVDSVVAAIQSLEAQVQSGTTYAEYSRAVSGLALAASTLAEGPAAQRQQAFLTSVDPILWDYQAVKDLWSGCVAEPSVCEFGFVSLTRATDATFAAQHILERFPALNKASAEGGALSNDGYEEGLNQARQQTLTQEVWADAVQKGRSLRSALR